MFFKKKSQRIEFCSPVDGISCPITEADDKAFAGRLLGDGLMIRPKSEELHAPCDAQVEMLFPTNHAIGLRLKDNTGVLLHFGLDTVELGGAGFEPFVRNGQKVKKGELLLKADLRYIKEHAKDNCLLIVFTEVEETKKINMQYKEVSRGDILAEWE